MLNRNLVLLVATSALLASVSAQLNRRHRRVRAESNRRLSPQRESMFNIEEEVSLPWISGCAEVVWHMLTHGSPL